MFFNFIFMKKDAKIFMNNNFQENFKENLFYKNSNATKIYLTLV